MAFRLLTLLAVVALAVGAWFLGGPRLGAHSGEANRRADSPGYFLKDGVLTEYAASGDPTVRIAAKRIDQVAHSEEVELHDVRVDYTAPEGSTWVMVGDVAHVRPGGTVVDIAGNVELQGMARVAGGTPVVRADTLSYDVTRGIATTPGDVHVDFLRDTLTARGLVANLRDRTIRLESRINGRFLP
jgi:LPS export ABC transporter protein LptC